MPPSRPLHAALTLPAPAREVAGQRRQAKAFLGVALVLATTIGKATESPAWPARQAGDEAFPILLAYRLDKLEKTPGGIEVAVGKGRPQALPLWRPIPLENVTLQALLTVTQSTLSYDLPWRDGLILAAAAGLIPAGTPEAILPGKVVFLVEFQDKDGRALGGRASIERRTAAGKILDSAWGELPLPAPSASQGATPAARAVLRVQAFDATGKELPASSESPAPLGVLAAWGDPRIQRPCQPDTDPAPALILIAFDTLRADRPGRARGGKPLMPVFEALAAHGFLFEHCYSPTAWTLPAFQALLTGLHPAQLGYGVGVTHDPMEDNFAKLRYGRAANVADLLRKEKNIHPFAATGGGMLEPWQNNLLKGFSYYWANPALAPLHLPDGGLVSEAQENAARFLTRLRTPRSGGLLGFFHTYQCHTPYADARFTPSLEPGRIRAPFGEGGYLAGGVNALQAEYTPGERAFIEALYDGDVAGADEVLRLLLDGISAAGLDRRAWIFITADHGEEFWEHGGFSHGHALYDEILRVPLLVVPPGGLKEGVRISEPVSLLDLFPTLCELAGVKPPPNLLGRSLKGLLAPDPAARAAANLIVPPGLFAACGTYYGPQRWALRSGRWKYIQAMGVEGWAKDPTHRKTLRLVPEELYDLDADPGETRNLAGTPEHEARRKSMAEGLALLRAGPLKPVDLSTTEKVLLPPPPDPALLEQLRKLGY